LQTQFTILSLSLSVCVCVWLFLSYLDYLIGRRIHFERANTLATLQYQNDLQHQQSGTTTSAAAATAKKKKKGKKAIKAAKASNTKTTVELGPLSIAQTVLETRQCFYRALFRVCCRQSTGRMLIAQVIFFALL
jgi:hypothetical protein